MILKRLYLPLILIGIFMNHTLILAKGDISYQHTSTKTSQDNKLKLGYSLSEQDKMGLSISAKNSEANEGEDGESSSLKISYRHRWEGGANLSADVKKNNESYFYEGKGLGIKYTLPIFTSSSIDKEASKLYTRMGFKYETQNKENSTLTKETFQTHVLSISLDQDLSWGVSTGFQFGKNFYKSSHNGITQALNTENFTLVSSNTQSYLSGLSEFSLSAYIEYGGDNASFGVSGSFDKPQFSTEKSSTNLEVYGDWEFIPDWTANLSLSQGKTEGDSSSTSGSQTLSAGIQYSF